MPSKFEKFGESKPSLPEMHTAAPELTDAEKPTVGPVLDIPADDGIVWTTTILPGQTAPEQRHFHGHKSTRARLTTGRPEPGTPRLKH